MGAPARWQERTWLARIIRVGVFCIPIALSFVFALVLSSRLPTPDPFVYRLGRWLAIAVLATGVLMVAQRLTRRLLPLAALMSLTLVFPDATPSRFGIALRTMSARQLEKRLQEVDEQGLGDTPTEAAETLLELVAALSRHDRLTRGHSERVRAYSIMIGEELRLGEFELDQLRWAALLHDVGKLHVAPEILNKPGVLTADEYEQIKLHTVAGQTLVAPLSSWLGEAADAVHQHHERFAGGGYPTGEPASELPQVSRIVSVADAFDVMTSARSYKPPISAGSARAELERCAGTQFDPVVVRAMMNVSLGALWRTMGPMAWIAQARFFPRPLTQGGTAASALLAALLALMLTGLAEASQRGGSDLALADGATPSWTEAGASGDAGGGIGADGGADRLGDGAEASDSAAGVVGSSGGDAGGRTAGDAIDSTTVPDGAAANSNAAETSAWNTSSSTSTTEPLAGSLSPTPIVVTLPPQLGTTTTTTTATTATTTTATTTATSTATTATTVGATAPTSNPSATVPATAPPPTIAATTTIVAPTTTTTVAPTTTTPTTTTPATTTTTTTTPTTTTTTTPVTTTTVPSDPNRFVLAAAGLGDQASQAVLQLEADRAPQHGALPNYDTDRNDDPGLTLTAGPGSLTSPDPATVQVWQFPPSYTTVDGEVTLDLWVAPAAAISGGSGLRMVAGLFECDQTRSACVRIEREMVDVDGAVGDFEQVTFDLTPNTTPYELPVDLRLELRVAVMAGSSVDGWIAFDASLYESQLVVTPQSAPLGLVPTGRSSPGDLPAAIVVTVMALLMAGGVQQWRIDHGRVRQFAFPTHG